MVLDSKLLTSLLFTMALIGFTFGAQADEKISYKTIEWPDLLPQDDFDALIEPPEELNNIEDGSEYDQISNQLTNALSLASDSRYQQALVSTNVIEKYDNQKIRLPGFIVPVTTDENQNVTEFFLVPYFGACIHVPPPPPNQIVFSSYKQGIKIDSIYEPYWIRGTLNTSITENDIAISAYSFTVDDIKVYE
jgi:hypothetical protein